MAARGRTGSSIHETVLQLVGERCGGPGIECLPGSNWGVGEGQFGSNATSGCSRGCGVYGVVDDRVSSLWASKLDVVLDPY